jgi:biotin carboxyl carrier protein
MADESSLLDPEMLRQLFRQLEQTDVDELEVSSGSTRIYIKREPGVRGAVHEVRALEEARPAGVPVIAPLTGVFYSRPTPDQDSFVGVGDIVAPGQVVCVIETMKIYNPVTVEIAGEVIDVVVRDGALVEAGQPVMYVLPGGGDGV